MHIKLRLLGVLGELAGFGEKIIENITDLDTLKQFLHRDIPSLEKHTYSVALNHEIKTGDVKFQDGDEVALLPPFSGG